MILGEASAVPRYLRGDRGAKVDASIAIEVAVLAKGPGRSHGLREPYALLAIDNSEPAEAFRTLQSLVRQTLLSADEEAKIGALCANSLRRLGRRDQAKAKAPSGQDRARPWHTRVCQHHTLMIGPTGPPGGRGEDFQR
jgi:hypothetical protein